jgi:hypothetical protein
MVIVVFPFTLTSVIVNLVVHILVFIVCCRILYLVLVQMGRMLGFFRFGLWF